LKFVKTIPDYFVEPGRLSDQETSLQTYRNLVKQSGYLLLISHWWQMCGLMIWLLMITVVRGQEVESFIVHYFLVGLCGLGGYWQEFSQPSWIESVLGWQKESGCYGDAQTFLKELASIGENHYDTFFI